MNSRWVRVLCIAVLVVFVVLCGVHVVGIHDGSNDSGFSDLGGLLQLTLFLIVALALSGSPAGVPSVDGGLPIMRSRASSLVLALLPSRRVPLRC